MNANDQERTPSGRIEVLLIVVQVVLGQLLSQHLARTRKFHVIGVARDPAEAIRLARNLRPKLIALEAPLLTKLFPDTLGTIWNSVGKVPVVVFNAPTEEICIKAALRAGVLGYISLDAPTSELTHAFEVVGCGKVFLSAAVARLVEDQYVRRALEEPLPAAPAAVTLSEREREIDQATMRGRRTKEIAHDLSVSSRTIEKHRENIRRKKHQRQFS